MLGEELWGNGVARYHNKGEMVHPGHFVWRYRGSGSDTAKGFASGLNIRS